MLDDLSVTRFVLQISRLSLRSEHSVFPLRTNLKTLLSKILTAKKNITMQTAANDEGDNLLPLSSAASSLASSVSHKSNSQQAPVETNTSDVASTCLTCESSWTSQLTRPSCQRHASGMPAAYHKGDSLTNRIANGIYAAVSCMSVGAKLREKGRGIDRGGGGYSDVIGDGSSGDDDSISQ